MFRRSLPSSGSLGSVPLPHRYYGTLRLPVIRLQPFRSSLALEYRRHPSFAPRCAGRARLRGQGYFFPDCCLPVFTYRRPHDGFRLSELNRTAHSVAVYASRLGLPLTTQTRFRPARAALAGRDFHPLGCILSFKASSAPPFLSGQAFPGAREPANPLGIFMDLPNNTSASRADQRVYQIWSYQ
jgi:hypothetical protein